MRLALCLILVAFSATANAAEPRDDWFNRFRRNETHGPLLDSPCACRPQYPVTRHYFRPTGPTLPYCGYIDPHPLYVDVRNISTVPIGKQFIIVNPSVTVNGVTYYYTNNGHYIYGQ